MGLLGLFSYELKGYFSFRLSFYIIVSSAITNTFIFRHTIFFLAVCWLCWGFTSQPCDAQLMDMEGMDFWFDVHFQIGKSSCYLQLITFVIGICRVLGMQTFTMQLQLLMPSSRCIISTHRVYLPPPLSKIKALLLDIHLCKFKASNFPYSFFSSSLRPDVCQITCGIV